MNLFTIIIIVYFSMKILNLLLNIRIFIHNWHLYDNYLNYPYQLTIIYFRDAQFFFSLPAFLLSMLKLKEILQVKYLY